MLRPRILTILCYAAMTSLAIGINLLPIFLVTIQHSFAGAHGSGLTSEQLGRIGSVTFIGLVGSILFTGPLADRVGAKAFAIAGNLLLAIGLVITSWSPSYEILLCANFLLGLGAGTLDMVLSPVVSALNPESRTSSMNWLHSFYCVGATITVLAGTLALQVGISWRNASLLLVAVPVLLTVLFAPMKFPAMTAEEGDRTPLPELLKSKWFLGALLAIFLGGATELGMAQWLPAYAELSLKYPQWVGGAALFAFSVCMAIGRMGIGALSQKLSAPRIMAIGCATSVFLFLGGSFIPVPELALACCVLAGLTGSCLWPTMLAITADKYPNGGATMFGALAAFGNAGGVFMPWVVGVIADGSNLHNGLAVSAIAPALMLPTVIALGKGELKKQAS